ncbi:hypothetical protein SAMN05445756_0506 [Kytococcus aerolatus]|uniref:ATP synthase protein I n=1 Tax=Kytococcus aerolatus TaxID=592308 RepID=A0A212T697_9MICO|nr:hypothetical protein [Kytococcus aerolatus]SNC61558.1 hypothetical protein SAMN05445756_0506 [Kytococcus aerolatus]
MSPAWRRDPFVLMVGYGVTAGAVATLAGVLVAGLVSGREQAIAALGIGLVAVIVLTSGLVMVRIILEGPRALVLPMGLLVFFAQVGLFAAVVLMLPWPRGAAQTLVGGIVVVVWQAGVVLGYARGRHALTPVAPERPSADGEG